MDTTPDLSWDPLYVVVLTDNGRHGGKRRPLPRVVGTTTPMTLPQAHGFLDRAAAAQDADATLVRFGAEIVPLGTPLAVDNPWDLSEYLPGLLDLKVHAD